MSSGKQESAPATGRIAFGVRRVSVGEPFQSHVALPRPHAAWDVGPVAGDVAVRLEDAATFRLHTS